MHQLAEPISVRFTFRPDRAAEFIEEHEVVDREGNVIAVSQPSVTQFDCDSIEEIMDYCKQFDDALLDCNAIINGQVINLSDYEDDAN